MSRGATGRAAAAAVLLLATGLPSAALAAESGAAGLVEREFRDAIKAVTPATVVLLHPTNRPGEETSTSSGVIVTKSGYVLSDGDAGAVLVGPRGRMKKEHRDTVEVRIPDLKKGTYAAYTAKVVRRVLDVDSCLLKITSPPPAGFAFVTPGTSDGLRVGAFTFAMGTPFGGGEDGGAALTAGIVASLDAAPPGDPAGRWLHVYTSAAVNPGVNGGPLVDADGALVGVISTWGQPEPHNPYQFIGKAFPIDRVKAAYKDLPEFSAVFPAPKSAAAPRSKQADLLERAFASAGRAAHPFVASLAIERSKPIKIPVARFEGASLPRYEGPVSAVVASADGWLVTALYNLADVASDGEVKKQVSEVGKATATFADGRSVPARFVAYDQRVGIALFKADVEGGYATAVPAPAPPEAFQVGRLVVSVANPFGAAQKPDPMLTIGMLSRIHPDDADAPWRGNFQTDAGMTDGTVGGALVDVQGRLLGVAALWDVAGQGRNSGIGYGIPWSRIEAALPAMKEGNSLVLNGYLGVAFERGEVAKISEVTPESPAARAGLAAGDVILEIEGKKVQFVFEARAKIRSRRAGETLKMVVERDKKRIDVVATLGERPPEKP
jgi:S1-C subfamily serine protease